MILAAGRGKRMRPLTDHTPKPLLPVGDKPLIVWHIERLVAAGVRDIVVNHAYLGEQIVKALGDGGAWGARISYSAEPPGAWETAGGIRSALGDGVVDGPGVTRPNLLAPEGEPFLVVNGDIWCDVDFSALALVDADLAHLVLVPNPPQHPSGDFCLAAGRVSPKEDAAGLPGAADPATLTFSGVGVYRPELFAGTLPCRASRLAPLLVAAMRDGRVSGRRHEGRWHDIGTPERLADIDRELSR
jgi:MurNAc alpha-1-phosphate uridylyltransferase